MYEKRTIKQIITPTNDPLFSEESTTIEIVDGAIGECLQIQQPDNASPIIQITPEEWPIIKKTIDEMIKECRKE